MTTPGLRRDAGEAWIFEAICLERSDQSGLRVIIGVEADLLGFRIEARRYAPGRRGRCVRRHFAASLSAAVVLAGQLMHEHLRAGFALQAGAPIC